MVILKQEWFWNWAPSIISTIIGVLLAVFVIWVREKINRTTQIKLEKIKIYDEKKFKAYLELYEFISTAFSLYWPPDEPRKDFNYLMKKYYYTKVKNHYPYINKNIREKLKILESQYVCLGDPDLKPSIPFDQFIETEYLKILNELEEEIEKLFDDWERN